MDLHVISRSGAGRPQGVYAVPRIASEAPAPRYRLRRDLYRSMHSTVVQMHVVPALQSGRHPPSKGTETIGPKRSALTRCAEGLTLPMPHQSESVQRRGEMSQPLESVVVPPPLVVSDARRSVASAFERQSTPSTSPLHRARDACVSRRNSSASPGDETVGTVSV